MPLPSRTIVSIILLSALAAGCGIRGPLTLPESSKLVPTNGTAATTPSTSPTTKSN